MKIILNRLKEIFTAQVFTFIAGVLSSLIVRAVFGGIIPLNSLALDLLMIFFVVFSISILISTRQSIRELTSKPKWTVNVLHALRSKSGDKFLYNPLVDLFISAEHSIRVLGLFRPLILEATSGRNNYYGKLNGFLEEKHKTGEPFKYERIIQVENSQPNCLFDNQVDSTTFDHCKFILSLQEQKSPLTIHLRQIPSALSSLSFVVIDDKNVLFAIPYINKSDALFTKALSLSTIVSIIDEEGTLVKEMNSLFDELLLNSNPIERTISMNDNNSKKS